VLPQAAAARYAGIVPKYVKPRWEKVPIGKVSHADVADWISTIRLSPASVRYVHRVFYLVLEPAVRDSRMSRNPAQGYGSRKPQRPKAVRGRDEVLRLADAAAQHPIPDAGEQYRALVFVLAFCGLRRGGQPGLRFAA
jgi:hypothetical protein